MKRAMTLFAVTVFILVFSIAWAVPGLINYQGKLTDNSGEPLTGSHSIRFDLFDSSTGGSSLWNETQNVIVTTGMYDIHLGSATTLPQTLFAANDILYLQVSVRNSSEVYEALIPRQRLTSASYAFHAVNADTLGGETADAYALSVHLHDDRYYTETEANTILSGKANVGHLHDERYFTESETNTLLGGKANVGHLHDERYYTQAQVDSMLANLQNSLQTEINALKALLNGVTRAGNDITFRGVNVRINNGTGTTDGTLNGLGNLIVGYNEPRGIGIPDDRSGSHNIIAGKNNDYKSYGGVVLGRYNTISGAYATVTGENNVATGSFSSISGGRNNEALGAYSYIGGGGDSNPLNGNLAFADYSAILGGSRNVTGDTFSGDHTRGSQSTVSGGFDNTASGYYASVSGGFDNTASYSLTSVSGGFENTASGYSASVSGGRNNTASGNWSFIGGGGSDNSANGNRAFAHYSAILGGIKNSTGTPLDITLGTYATISGGDTNIAVGGASTVSGGVANTARGWRSAVSGGSFTTADQTNEWCAAGSCSP